MSKKRIHELAKEYGMSGKDLAAKLRNLGYSNAKSHMTALDEFEVIQAQGLLEAHGVIQESTPSESVEDLGGGLILRKKKKKKKVEAIEPQPAASVPEAPAPEPEVVAPAPVAAVEAPAPAEATAPAATPAATPATEEAPIAAEATTEEAPAVEEPAPVVEVVAEAPVEAPAVEPQAAQEPAAQEAVAAEEQPAPVAASAATPAPAAAQAEPTAPAPVKIQSEPAATAPAPASTRAPKPAAAAASAKGATAAEAAPSPGAAPVIDTKVPVKPKRQGKVVGFIDLSKIQSDKPQRQSRRLRSRDDVMPNVQPTMRHDPSRVGVRGDRGARDVLSASQLREREAGRFLRRGRQQFGGGRGGRGGRSRGRDPLSFGSPMAGTEVKIEEPLTIRKLAETISVRGNDMLKTAWAELGFGKVNINSTLDEDTAILLADEYEVTLQVIKIVEAEDALIQDLKATRSAIEEGLLETRSPTVAFLGHVDHGKTTLIDKIRSSTVADGEDGGITQHIGAYRVTTEKGHDLTIIDTPGHAAFTNMRARGAKAVDVVVLVVAADAGVQPQTEEALAHAKAAGAPIVVALTKSDRAEANPQKAQEQLAGLELIPEAWGGETAMVPVSGITGDGVQDLLERVFLESEILELNCHAEGPASGVVLEAEIEKGKGIVAHVLVQDGTLKRGDVILAGEGYGKVRSLTNDRGVVVDDAGPSVPVEVSGLSSLPGIGEAFHVVKALGKAKEVAEERARKTRAQLLANSSQEKGLAFLEAVTGPKVEEVNVIIRTDVQGSAEVLKQSVNDLANPEVRVKVIQAGVGGVTENDVLLASTSDALILAFRVGVNAKARQGAEREGVEVRNYSVLYNVLDDLREIMEGRLAPEIQEDVVGHAEVRRVFKSSKFGSIAGSYIIDGAIARDNRVRLLRDNMLIWTGALASIRRESDEAKEVREGFECGILLKGYNDVREGDIIEGYKITEIKRTLADVEKATPAG